MGSPASVLEQGGPRTPSAHLRERRDNAPPTSASVPNTARARLRPNSVSDVLAARSDLAVHGIERRVVGALLENDPPPMGVHAVSLSRSGSHDRYSPLVQRLSDQAHQPRTIPLGARTPAMPAAAGAEVGIDAAVQPSGRTRSSAVVAGGEAERVGTARKRVKVVPSFLVFSVAQLDHLWSRLLPAVGECG